VTQRPLTYLEYVKAAFWRRAALPGLGALRLNLMGLAVFAVLGLANPGFWLLGAALEVGYLAFVGGSRRFQTLVDGERLLAAQRGWDDQVHLAVERLGDESRERYRHLLGQCRTILGLSDGLDADSLGSLRDLKARNLNQLLTIFLRLLSSRELIRASLASVDQQELEREIERNEKRLAAAAPAPSADKPAAGAAADPALLRSLQGTIEIQKKRRDNLVKAGSSLQVIESELLRIEQQVELLREESAVAGNAEALSTRLDAVTTQMAETSRWMDANSQLLGSLGVEDSGPALAALPRLPETE
jgi:hypothetical protein